MTDWMPLLGGLAEGFGTYYGAKQDAEAQEYVADIQKQIAELKLSGDKYLTDIARLSALETAAIQYPGQMETGQSLSEYLQSKVGTGLTEDEKGLYRSSGTAAIEKGITGALEETETSYASQGLRGGAVAESLGQISGSRPELYGSLESKIMEADIGAKEQNIAQTLAFLQTFAAPRSPGGESAEGVGGTPISSPIPSGGGVPSSYTAPSGVTQPTFSGGRSSIMGTATPFTQPMNMGTSGGSGGGGIDPSIASALAQLGANPNISSAQFRHRADILRGVEKKDISQYYDWSSLSKAQQLTRQVGGGAIGANPYNKVGIGNTWSW